MSTYVYLYVDICRGHLDPLGIVVLGPLAWQSPNYTSIKTITSSLVLAFQVQFKVHEFCMCIHTFDARIWARAAPSGFKLRGRVGKPRPRSSPGS